MDPLKIDTVKLSPDGSALVIIDQTLLPNRVEYLSLTRTEDIFEAIRSLRVRGAPAIGVAAGFGAYLAAKYAPDEEMEERFYAACDDLAGARPTAVNLFYALNRMKKAMERLSGNVPSAVREGLRAEAQAIMDEDIAISRAIGQHGLLQGARLSAFEMLSAGVDTTLLCDNMASSLMKEGKVDIIFVGCDRVAANGDAANKIGTSAVAILAKHYGIPFYVCAPSSTIDMSLTSGTEIPIEHRAPEEVTELWYEHRMAPEGVKVYNPAFDVTDAELITGIISEHGIAEAPYGPAFRGWGL